MDEFYGYRGNDVIDNSAGGSAWLQGGDGNDTIIGGNEVDFLVGGFGSDTMNGGAGNDVYRYNGKPVL